MSKRYVLALDQGTTSSRSILFDHHGKPVATAQKEFKQYYPQPGWVEHDPLEIWESQLATAKQVLEKSGAAPGYIAAIGITNQRETTVVWDRKTGTPIHNAIVWQCRRTTEICERLKAAGMADEFQQRTGLVIDAYFSGTKLKWILDHADGAKKRAARSELCFGTIDAWLLYKLTGLHATDYSNASRTLLFNIHQRQWDQALLETLQIPPEVLPQALPSSHAYASTKALGGEIPVASLIGDQQSALFGQAAFNRNDCKNTYGTGCFLLMNTGDHPVTSKNGLLTTIAWGIGDRVEYALEGSVFVGGAVIQWLRDELRLIDSAAQSEELAAQVPDTGGVYIVPAFVGLGAPYWDMRARGTIVGLTRGAGCAHIVRAALEAIAFQSADVVRTMEADTGGHIPQLRVDGGAAANNLLMQHQADLLNIPVVRGKTLETTALGAAFLAGLAVGFWKNQDEIAKTWQVDRVFEPAWEETRRSQALSGWADAIRRTKSEIL